MPDSVGGAGFPRNINIGHEHLNIVDGFTYQYQGGVPTNVLNWKIINGVTNVDPSTVGWGANQLGAAWFNSSDRAYKFWDGIQIQTIQSAPPKFNYRTTSVLQDEFLTGSGSSGLIGSLGWNGAGSISTIGTVNNHPGIYRFDTGAVSGTTARINMFGNDKIITSEGINQTFVIQLNTNDANTTMRIGASSVWIGVPPHGVYFEKLDADNSWFCVARSAGTETRVSGAPITLDFQVFTIIVNENSATYMIDNTVVNTISTNIPTTSQYIGAGASIVNSAAANKSFDIDYFELTLSNLRR